MNTLLKTCFLASGWCGKAFCLPEVTIFGDWLPALRCVLAPLHPFLLARRVPFGLRAARVVGVRHLLKVKSVPLP